MARATKTEAVGKYTFEKRQELFTENGLCYHSIEKNDWHDEYHKVTEISRDENGVLDPKTIESNKWGGGAEVLFDRSNLDELNALITGYNNDPNNSYRLRLKTVPFNINHGAYLTHTANGITRYFVCYRDEPAYLVGDDNKENLMVICKQINCENHNSGVFMAMFSDVMTLMPASELTPITLERMIAELREKGNDEKTLSDLQKDLTYGSFSLTCIVN